MPDIASIGGQVFDGGTVTGSPADLVRVSDVQRALPGLTPAELADLPAVITAVSVALEGHCRRKLALQPFDRVYRPGRTRKIYLDTWPVVMGRLRTDLVVPLTIANTDVSTNQAATVQLTATQLLLWRIASGVPAPAPFTLASYPTVTELAAAVRGAGGGWTATVAAGLDRTAISELNPDREVQGAQNQAAELRCYLRDVERYALDPARGVIELTENRPEAYRYGDRAFGQGYGFSWSSASEPRNAGVRAIYRGGYAVQDWDLAAGYEPVPEPLRRAAILAVRATLDATPAPQVVRETAGAYSYALEGPPAVLPDLAMRLAGPYVSKRL